MQANILGFLRGFIERNSSLLIPDRVDHQVQRSGALPFAGCRVRMPLRFLCWWILLLVLPGTAQGGEFPLWEAGAGVGVLSLPDYRGSDERRVYALPIPYLVYRGEIFKVDRKSVRGLLLQSERLDVEMSFNASPPVSSRSNQAREGMPDLDPTGEVGPSLIIKLGESPLLGARVTVHLPARVVAATDLTYLKEVGYVFNPRLNFDWPLDTTKNRWNAGLTVGPLYADKRYHEYFYAVDLLYATAGRPAYAVRGGYSGLQATATMSRRFEKVWFGAFVRIDDLHGAVFEDSPLVKSMYSIMGGFALSWVFETSDVKVTAEE